MANTYLTRSLSSTSTSWTISLWVKRSLISSNQYMISWGSSGSTSNGIGFSSADLFQYYSEATGSNPASSAVYRDTNGWYHLVVKNNAGTITLYVNGEAITTTGGTSGSALSSSTFTIGRWTTGEYSFNGSMSHVHLTDGTAYDPTAFGEYDANGVWKINTSPSVTYGTNGFFILKDGNSVTDQSGNGNNFTVGGGTLTNTEDSPSNVFATGNPLDTKVSFAPVFSNGNNTISGGGSGTGDRSCRGTLGFASGKFYWEIKYTSNSTGNSAWTGILNPEELLVDGNTQSTQTTNSVLFRLNGGELRKNGSLIATYSGDVNDIFGFAYDLDAGTLKIHKNGTYFNSGNAVVTSISADTYLPYFAPNSGSSYVIMNPNFGNGYFGTTAVSSAGTNASGIGIFEYDVPTGFTALSTKGLNL
jgi:hypothetical protein